MKIFMFSRWLLLAILVLNIASAHTPKVFNKGNLIIFSTIFLAITATRYTYLDYTHESRQNVSAEEHAKWVEWANARFFRRIKCCLIGFKSLSEERREFMARFVKT